MGKNQTHKALQRSRHQGGGEEAGAPELGSGDGTVDASFHTPEWHAARIAALTTQRMSWEDWKKQRKEEDAVAEAAANEEERLMKEYRAQLDADRAKRLAPGVNHAAKAGKVKKKSSKSKDRKKDKAKKRKGDGARKESSRKKAKRARASSASGSSSSGGSGSEGPAKGPIRLSDFMRS